MTDVLPRSKTGIPGLDVILNGGLIPNELYLVDGNPGAGKTTLALQYLIEGIRCGEKGLYVTLSETKKELEAGAGSHGWSLEGIEIIELIADQDELQAEEQLTMLPPSEVELGETTRRILQAVGSIKPARVVFDSLSELRLLAQSSLRYRRQILALKQFFVGRQCTVLISTIELRKARTRNFIALRTLLFLSIRSLKCTDSDAENCRSSSSGEAISSADTMTTYCGLGASRYFPASWPRITTPLSGAR